MAGIRPNDPSLDDKDMKINKTVYTDSEYTGSEAKSDVKTSTDNQTNVMKNATPTTTPPSDITSDVINDGNDNSDTSSNEEKVISDGQKQTQNDQLTYVADNNPGYLEEMGLSQDEILGINESGNSGITYQEDEVVMDENGLIYLDPNQSQSAGNYLGTNNLTGSQVFATGQLKIIQTSDEFAYPTDPKGHTSSDFSPRVLENGGPWRFHTGIDIAGGKNAICIYGNKDNPAIVVDCFNGNTGVGNPMRGFGNYIRLQFNYKGKILQCFYGHLESINVVKGKQLYKGNVIGVIGGSGKIPQYPIHLHFEIIDPVKNNIWNRWVTRSQSMSVDTPYRNKNGVWIQSDSARSLTLGIQNKFLAQVKYQNFIDPEEFFRDPNKFVSPPTLTLQS